MPVRGVVEYTRAFGIGSAGITYDVRRHDLAAAATQLVVLAARARLARVSPGPERPERLRCRPVARDRAPLGASPVRGGRRRCGEAARRELTPGLRADEEVPAAA